MYKRSSNQGSKDFKGNYSPRRNGFSSGGRNGSSFGRGGQSFGARPKRVIKKLDHNLFINKAASNAVEIGETATSNVAETNILFSNYPLVDKLKRNIADHSYVHPTEIQEKTITPILEGRDVIGIANTGTGKTAAFLIPLINKVVTDRNERVFIVAPTRELALQILDELRIFIKGMDFDAVALIGGSSIERQEKKLRHNPHFVVGTPGRIKDMINRKRLNLHLFRNVVLDEVDRMVDIGFIHDVKLFISLLPVKRQSLFFSATITDKVRDILNDFVTNPVSVSLAKRETSENIEQDIIKVRDRNQKVDVLHDLLVNEAFNKVIIFGRTKWGIEKLAHSLMERGFRAGAIHGNKTQGQRQRVIDQFKKDEIRILLATDVASRGLDIDNVSHVINYDAPESYDDYVHRIGRTGRAGKKGYALTFVE